MHRNLKILIEWFLLAGLISACKFMQAVETLPAFQPTATEAAALPTFTPGPTITPTILPTATLFKGTRDVVSGHWYLVSTTPRSWLTSQEYCAGMGAHLVTIESARENQFVYSLAPETWLGASMENDSGAWSWVSGEPFQFRAWAPGEPHSCPAAETCQPAPYLAFASPQFGAVAAVSSQWSNVPAAERLFVCEWDQ